MLCLILTCFKQYHLISTQEQYLDIVIKRYPDVPYSILVESKPRTFDSTLDLQTF